MKKENGIEFRIESDGGTQIDIVQEIPKSLRKYNLIGGQTHYYKADFGDMLFHHHAGDGFSIWYSNYLVRHKARVIGWVDISVLEWHMHIRNRFTDLNVNQLGMSYAPHIHNTVEFAANTQYDTFDIHLYKSFLQEYAKNCPALNRFLLRVEGSRDEPVELLTETQYLDPEMIRLINSILQYDCRDDFAASYYESVVNQLLIRFIRRLDKMEGLKPQTYSFQDVKLAEDAKLILETEVGKAYTIPELSSKLDTNPYRLSATFKFVFDCTIYECAKAARMNHAQYLLLETQMTQFEIGLLIGYNDQSNFAIAFKNYFGLTPGEFRKQHGKRETD